MEMSEFASGLSFEIIPEEVVDRVKLCLLDTIGCGVFGARDTRSKILTDVLRNIGGWNGGPATVWHFGFKASPADAALLNGSFVHSYDFDDQCQEVGVHAGACVVPAALAIAEHMGGITGKEFLTSLVVGYECAIRVGIAFGLSPLSDGWHIAGFNGTFGSTTAAGRLLGLDADQMMNAIGLGATQGAGLMSVQYGSDAKGMNCGKAAQSGVYASLLAQKGFKGIRNVIELPYGGYVSTLSSSYDLQKITLDIGTKYMINEKLAFKKYPSVRWVHAPVEAAQRIMRQNSLRPLDIERVVVKVTSIGKEHVGWRYEPQGITSALSNLPYGVAIMILEGNLSAIHFTDEWIQNPAVLKMTEKIVVQVDEALDKEEPFSMGATVDIITKDGNKYSECIDYPIGTPGKRPMSETEILEKFRQLMGEGENANRILECIENLEKVQDARKLASLLHLDWVTMERRLLDLIGSRNLSEVRTILFALDGK